MFLVLVAFLQFQRMGLVLDSSGMETGLADLRIMEAEDDEVQLPSSSAICKSVYEFCFLGCFAIVSVIHFTAMHNTLANVWYPLGCFQITDLGEKRILFRFYNRVDFERVIRGALWTFNNHLLVFHCLKTG